MQTIKVKFTCGKCGIKDKEVEMEERREDEDVIQFVERVGRILSTAHNVMSPFCRITELTEIKIPVSKNEDLPLGRFTEEIK